MQCEICGGSGKIRLPRRKPLSIRVSGELPSLIENDIAIFNCPECSSETINKQNISILNFQQDVPDYLFYDQYQNEYEEVVIREMIYSLSQELYKSGHFVIDKQFNKFSGRCRITATLGIVDKKTLEEVEQERKVEFDKALALEKEKIEHKYKDLIFILEQRLYRNSGEEE